MNTIKIETSSGIILTAELYNTPTAEKIVKQLPFENKANTWGNEIYFDLALNAETEKDASETVDAGNIAYWAAGNAFCIFFGPTPISTDNKPVAAGPVNICGIISEDYTALKNVKNGEKIQVTLQS